MFNKLLHNSSFSSSSRLKIVRRSISGSLAIYIHYFTIIGASFIRIRHVSMAALVPVAATRTFVAQKKAIKRILVEEYKI